LAKFPTFLTQEFSPFLTTKGGKFVCPVSIAG